MALHRTMIDSRSGFCPSNSTFYSKKPPLPLPSNPYLDVTTFISSHPNLGRTAFIDAQTGQQVTYPQLWTSVHSISTSLSSLGIRKGDVILILSPNSIFFPVVCHSVLSLGAIITTANPLNTPNELAAQIADSKPVLAFTIEPLLPKLSKTNLHIVLIGNNSGLSSKTITTLDEMMKKEPSQARFEQRVNQEDTASLMYSSGTTGKSKGVLASHLNLIVMAQNVLSRVQAVEGHQTVISTVPMFHIYGFGWFALGLLASGSTIVVIPKFDKEEMISAVEKYGVTYLPIAPPVITTMIKNADEIRTRCDLSSLQTVLSGGAPLSKEVIEGFHEKYPRVNIFQGYALTESTGLGASTDSVEESKRFGSVGLLSASLVAKIVDIESRMAVGVNRMGELWLRGPSIMKGYLNNPEATALTLESNGWLKTGDLCYIDNDGFIYVVDRMKELIKYKGYQVPPAELESLLLTHPQILDAAVIPLPNKDVGQLPMAYVVRKAGNNLSGNTVMEFVARQVAPYKRIRHVEFIGNIPKNPSGKILRRDLVKLATSKI